MYAGMRIFRMLLAKKQLEQKQIADFAMVPVREAREVLYKMLKGGFLALQVCCTDCLLDISFTKSIGCPHAAHTLIKMPCLTKRQ